MVLASWGLFWIQAFICCINSNICSGGRDATALLIASGALPLSTAGPKGLSLTGSVIRDCISILLFSVHALSTLRVLPAISTPFRFLMADKAVSWSLYSQNPYPMGFPVSLS